MQPEHVIDTVHTVQPTATDLWATAQNLGLPAALWRLPNQRNKHLIVSLDETLPRVSVDLEELPAGFAISPFDNLDRGADSPAQTLFLRADIQAVFDADQTCRVFRTDQRPGLQVPDAFKQALAQQSRRQPPRRATMAFAEPIQAGPAEQAQYIRHVTEAIEAMQRGEFRKVVLSRTKQVRFADAPNAVDLFDKLCEKYPTAFVSAVSLPEKGQIWLSATPERLVSQDAYGIFRTVSLAGTQSAVDANGIPKRPSEAMWSQKEIEEQALVSRYIIECFKKIRLREYVEEGPKTIIAGNLMHLGTQFTVDTQEVRYPQLGTVMLRLLHPTSAVCGTPRDAAFTFIRQHESHPREFYAGFLGPINIDANHEGAASHLFVHIRCMKLEGPVATLYAGAGLTEDSVPEREWLETEMKCQTLLSVISEQLPAA